MKSIFFLLLASFPIFAQVQGIVKDEAGNPISYANISVENQNLGTTSEENGTFSLKISKDANLIFSALGYEDKILKSIEAKEVILVKKIFEFEEIVVESRKKTKKATIGKYSGEKLDYTLGNTGSDNTHILAKFIEFSEQIRQHPYINSIEFQSNSQVDNAMLRIRIFDVDENGIPTEDVVNEDILVTVKKGKRNNTVDLSKYQIKIQEEGIVIGFEYLKLEQNKHFKNFVNETPEQRQKNFSYEPGILCFLGKNKIRYFNKDRSPKKSEIKGNIEIALKISLTN